jgi:hypothetical protein
MEKKMKDKHGKEIPDWTFYTHRDLGLCDSSLSAEDPEVMYEDPYGFFSSGGWVPKLTIRVEIPQSVQDVFLPPSDPGSWEGRRILIEMMIQDAWKEHAPDHLQDVCPGSKPHEFWSDRNSTHFYKKQVVIRGQYFPGLKECAVGPTISEEGIAQITMGFVHNPFIFYKEMPPGSRGFDNVFGGECWVFNS